MKHSFALFTVAAFTLNGLTASAQLREPQSRPIHSFSVGYRAGFNISADFHNLGGVPSASSPGPDTGGGLDRFYDDGYNRVDSSGNAGDRTWFWGYENAGQLPGNDTIVMSSSYSTPVSSQSNDGDPQHGFEVSYQFEVGPAWGRSYWGFEGAFNFLDLTISDNRTLAGNLVQILDAYALGGIIPPLAPYNGTFSGPGPLISDTPTRTQIVTPNGAAISGQRNIDAQIFGFRAGPYLQIPFCENFSMSLSGGLALALADSQFSFQETISIPGGGTVSNAGNDSDNEFLYGGYLSATANVLLPRNWHLFGSVQYQNVGSYSHDAAGKNARIDLGQSVFVSAGVGFSF